MRCICRKKKCTCESKGSASRETRCCKLTITLDAAKIGSIVCWGIAACPPFPVITASKKPLPAITGPGLEATVPMGKSVATWCPKIASTFSNTPASTIFFAPPPPSSAGWKRRTTVPFCNHNNSHETFSQQILVSPVSWYSVKCENKDRFCKKH